jgi:hypothetical protein
LKNLYFSKAEQVFNDFFCVKSNPLKLVRCTEEMTGQIATVPMFHDVLKTGQEEITVQERDSSYQHEFIT